MNYRPLGKDELIQVLATIYIDRLFFHLDLRVSPSVDLVMRMKALADVTG